MASSVVVFYKIATTCLLIVVGFILRRMKILPENSVSFISKYLMFMALPAATLSLTIAEVHGGAARLAARTVLWSTLASLFTAPAATWMAEAVYRGL